MLSERAYSDLSSTYPYHYEASGIVRAAPDRVFAHLDDHARLSAHMSESSWMMAGGSTQVEFDAGRGQRTGSWIRLSGTILGVNLAVEEVVTERTPPRRKVWETIGAPRLLVIGHYRMGFEIVQQAGSRLTVFIDYALPEGALTRWLGYFLGGYYARWCAQRMLCDAVRHFGSSISIGRKTKGGRMKKFITAVFFLGAIGLVPLLAQEKKDMPMKSEGMQGGMMMGKMKEMQGKMTEMHKGMSGMMKGQGMMKSEDMKGMGGTMGNMSGMMGDMGQMMGEGKMTPEEMGQMSKMMGDMSAMMKQMSERMNRGAKKAN